MVAKINRGVSLYGAVIYNQRKVDEATARIIAGNRMITDLTGNPHNVMQQTLWAFESYLAANRNTEKPVLHISLNPSVDDRLTDGQFAELAREYMQKMGYGDQPYIVYLHEDIDRRHVHIVSTCVKENGEKISDAYEWNRSMKACREQAEGTAGTVSQEGGLPGRGRKTSGRQYPKEHFHRLPLPDIRGVQCHALMLQHRGQTGSGRI